MDEKDRLGEKMKLKERAREDRYFAERDRELLTRLKQAHMAEQGKKIHELARSRCPMCREQLRQSLFYGIMIEECPTCQGIWLGKGKVERISLQGGEGWIGSFLEGLTHLLGRSGGPEARRLQDTLGVK
jgi:hypothetical protein